MRCFAVCLLACAAHAQTVTVTTEWLAAHLKDPHLAILAVGDKAAYDRAHIPGAVYLAFQDVQNRLSPLTLELPPIAALADTLAHLGVSNDSRIILYDAGNQISRVTRVYLSFDAVGLAPRTSILDGGFPAWENEHRPATTDSPTVTPASLTPHEHTSIIVDAAYVKANLKHSGVAIVDARVPDFYTGRQTGTNKRPGHIPGAVNIPFNSLVDKDGKLLPAPALRKIFEDAGVHASDQVVSYCHIGQQATVVYWAARSLGMDARLYDGSWEDWSARTELPTETGEKH